MMTEQFPHLFTPIKIGPKTAKNRVVFPAHGVPSLPFMDDSADGDAFVEYQATRARGGCGLTIVGNLGCYDRPIRLGPTPSYPPTPDKLIPKLQRLADAVHKYDTLCLIQLYIFSDAFLMIPSNGTLGYTGLAARMESVAEWQNLENADLEKNVEMFARYAELCKRGGVDGIQIHACHGDLVQQSWSTWANQRDDKWGEPTYFATRILSAVRSTVGKDFIVSIRISADDYCQGGMGIDDTVEIARALIDAGNVDLLGVSLGCEGPSNAYTIGSMYIPAGSISIPLTSRIKQVVGSVPVVATSRINTPEIAENSIAEGHTDMIGLVRGQIADPEFTNKAREGRVDDIRLCIGCNQGCWESEEEATCLQNAVANKESTEYAVIKPAAVKKKVIVVGGGPGGMEAARVAAIKGHDVILYEKSDKLGGQVNILSRAPGRLEFSQVIRYLETQIKKLGVEIELNTEATPDLIIGENPDAVIVATGAVPYILPVPGSDQDNVVSPSQVLTNQVDTGDRILVFETTGMQEGPTTADFLAEQGKSVELMTQSPAICAHWGLKSLGNGTHIPVIWERLKRNGVTVTPLTEIKEISGKTVTVSDTITGEERVIEDIDTFVMATGYRSENRLYKALKDRLDEVYEIGDCKIPRRCLDAIHEGYMTAFGI
ncbi:MAG: FAD-dependent oxidoreductase [Dehalococcoidales bacterium]|nr:MAG: FAD-dependent oxidoreductase [Dehalococcoidales bacterium]